MRNLHRTPRSPRTAGTAKPRRNSPQWLVECAALESRRLFCMSGDLVGQSSVLLPAGDPESPIQIESVGPESIDQLTVPALSSRPSAGRKLYLDFNGHPTIEGWGGWAIGGEDAGPTPAFDTDGDNDDFSGIELNQIEKIWKGVSEKFSPFNIDVTTIAPSKINGARIVIGGDGSWHGSGGGVAQVGGWGEEGFTDVKGANVAFVWGGQASSNLAYIVEAIAHETGHTLDLYHQSRNPLTAPGNEYVAGLIMGAGHAGIGRWAFTSETGGLSSSRDGETIVSEGGQNDLVRITDTGDNGFGFRVDDAGNSALTGTQVSLPITSQNGVLQAATTGVIEQNGDVDVYRISHNGGSLDIEVLAAEFRRMLDPTLTLHRQDAPGQISLVGTSSSNTGSDGVGERLQFNQLNSGTYFITIGSSGSYGDIGQYRLNVRAGSPQASNDTIGTATRLGAFGRTTAEFLALGFAGTANIADGLVTTDEVDYFKIVVPGPAGGNLSARITGAAGATLAIITDVNGDGIVGNNEIAPAPLPTNGATSIIRPVFAGNVAFVRVARESAGLPVSSYQLRITTDMAPAGMAANNPNSAFDPTPLQGSKLVNESIDSTLPDTTDYYRVTAAAAGTFSFNLFPQDNTGDLRLDAGIDNNLNGFLDTGEVLGSSAQSGVGSFEQINNLAVAQGQRMLVKVSQQTNTSDNYVLQAIADYATGGNLTGAITSATNMTGRFAASINEHLGSSGDVFDTYQIAPPVGLLTARITPLQLGAGHRLEIIRDANANGVLEHGDIVASGFNTELSFNVPSPGLFPPTYFLRVASVLSGGEFPSIGNYNLTFITAGATANQTFTSPQAITVTATPRAANGYLAFDPADANLTDLEDFFQFTLSSRTRVDLSSSDPKIGVQVGQLDAGNFRRIGGVGTFQGTLSNLSVNLDPGTYLVRTYLPVEERQLDPSGGNYTLFVNSAAITDTAPPLVTATEFQYEIRPVGPIFTVDQDVRGSIDPGDVVVRNLATNTTFPIGQTFYDSSTHRIGYGVAAGTLPDGNYRATLLAGSLRDASANPLAAESSFDFFVFAGDANRDRRVDIADFSILATRFNLQGTFSQGDFNYDHVASIADFAILAGKFNTNLPAADLPGGASGGISVQRAAAASTTRPIGAFANQLIKELGNLAVIDGSIQ